MSHVAKRVVALGLLLAIGTVGSAGAAPQAKPATTLQVFAAASLSDAFNEIAEDLEKQQPGLRVRIAFAGSQQLAAQLEQGAAADVFASADERWMTYVEGLGLLDGGSAVFARNTLIVIVPKTNPARIGRLQDLAKGGVKLVIGAEAVPAGAYSRVMLKNLSKDPAFGSDFAARTLRNVVSEEENVRSVVGKVQLGEADAGIVYRSDVSKGVARYIKTFEVPAAANIIARYPIAVMRESKNADAARAFVERVLSPEGQAVLARHGFLATTK